MAVKPCPFFLWFGSPPPEGEGRGGGAQRLPLARFPPPDLPPPRGGGQPMMSDAACSKIPIMPPTSVPFILMN